MALPLHDPEQMPNDRGWHVSPVFTPLPFSTSYLSALTEMHSDSEAPGHSDVGIRNLLFSLIISLKPQSVLEIGGHIGSATLVMAEALRLNNFGQLFTIEPQDHYFHRLMHYVTRAQLSSRATILHGFSHSPEILSVANAAAPFELIFIDACHDYSAVLEDLKRYGSLLSDNGIFVCHDTSLHAQSFDTTKLGGVRSAILEFCDGRDFVPAFFEYPLWLNNCGAALIWKQSINNRPGRRLLDRCLSAFR